MKRSGSGNKAVKRILVVASTDSMIWNFLIPHINLWKKKGFDVECACEKTGFYFDELISTHGLVVHRVCFQRNPASKKNIKAFYTLKRLVRNHDLIVCQEPVGGALSRIASINCNARVLYTAHGFHFYKGCPIKNWILYYPVERILSNFTDALVTINEEDFQRANHFHAKSVYKIDGIGADLTRIEEAKRIDKKKKKRELGINQDSTVIITAAEMIPRKNYPTALKAINQLKDKLNYEYIICGDGADEAAIKEMALEYGIRDRVHFLGFRKDLDEIFAISDVFLFPSYQEGLSIALIEAMASGLSIVCSDIRGNRDLIDQGCGGTLVKPDDYVGFAEGIKTALANKENFARYNNEKVKQYSIGKAVSDFYSIIETVLSQ